MCPVETVPPAQKSSLIRCANAYGVFCHLYHRTIGRHPPDARTRSSEEQRLRNALSPIDVNLGAHHTCAGRGFRGSEATIGECHRINVRSRRRSKVNGRYSGYCLGTSGCSIALRALRLVRLLHFVRGFSESHPEASLCDVIEWE